MKIRLSLLTSFVLLSLSCFGQVGFKPGYFIDKQGNKTECFIEDQDPRFTPKSITYRLTGSRANLQIDVENLSEFSVPDRKYIRVNVQYDRSSQQLNDLTIMSDPDWTQGDLFVKVIVDGKANLYQYISRKSTLYFFSVDGSPIEQLVFKEYLRPSDPTLTGFNRTYLSQLHSKVNCGVKTTTADREVPYELKALKKHFGDFNVCSGDAPVEDAAPGKTITFRVTPGVEFTKVGYLSSTGREQTWSRKAGFRIGVDVQIVPFQHGKVALIAEPNISRFSGIDDTGSSTLTSALLEVPIGVRYRVPFSDKNYFFINAMLSTNFPISHKHENPIGSANPVQSIVGGGLGHLAGAGFSLGRFSIEGRLSRLVHKSSNSIIKYTYTKQVIVVGFRIN